MKLSHQEYGLKNSHNVAVVQKSCSFFVTAIIILYNTKGSLAILKFQPKLVDF